MMSVSWITRRPPKTQILKTGISQSELEKVVERRRQAWNESMTCIGLSAITTFISSSP
jgi:hypothetical protein